MKTIKRAAATAAWVLLSTATACAAADDASESGIATMGPATDSGPGEGWTLDAEGGTEEGGGIVNRGDLNTVGVQCDIFKQDCTEGEKCMPYGQNGANWNATKCVPVAANAGQRGDDCTAEDSRYSGVDDCDVGLMCWDVDESSGAGRCVGLCEGSFDAPSCAGGQEICSIANEGVIAVCLQTCDPLSQNCAAGQGCYALTEGFVCGADRSGTSGAFGDACQGINTCDPGNLCLPQPAVAGCTSVGCCSSFCTIGSRDCPAGHECFSATDLMIGTTPAHQSTGVCALPGE